MIVGLKNTVYLTPILIIYLILCITPTVFSEDLKSKADSIRNCIANTKSDTLLAQQHTQLAELIYQTTFDSTIISHYTKTKSICIEGIKNNLESKKIDSFKKSLLECLEIVTYYYYNTGNTIHSIENQLEIISFFEQLEDNVALAKLYNDIGKTYEKFNIQKSIEYYSKALSISKKYNYELQLARAYSFLAGVYDLQGDKMLAIEYMIEGIKLFEKLNDPYIGDYYWNIALKYRNIQDTTNYLSNLKTAAVKYLNQGTDYGIGSNFYALGELHSYLAQHDSSIYFYQQCLVKYKAIHFKRYIGMTWHKIAQQYIALNMTKKAKIYADSALNYAKQDNNIHLLSNVNKDLYNLNKNLNLHQQALSHYEIYIQMRDSIKNSETQKTSIREQTKYEFEKAQLVAEQRRNEELRIQNEKLERRNNLQYSAIFIAIIGVFGLVMALGKIQVSSKVAEGLIFFAFLLFFEFLLVLFDPYIENITNGAPVYKLLANAFLAGFIFPLHTFFETTLKQKLIKNNG